jgi:hypothetical protein
MSWPPRTPDLKIPDDLLSDYEMCKYRLRFHEGDAIILRAIIALTERIARLESTI